MLPVFEIAFILSLSKGEGVGLGFCRMADTSFNRLRMKREY